MPATLIALEKAPAYLAALPAVFAMQLEGDCMAPNLLNGSVGVFSRDEWLERGDLACIWIQVKDPTRNGMIGVAPWIKRIVDPLPWRRRLPFQPTWSNILPMLSFEQISPPRRYTVDATGIHGLHKFLGTPADLDLVQPAPGYWRFRPTLEQRVDARREQHHG